MESCVENGLRQEVGYMSTSGDTDSELASRTVLKDLTTTNGLGIDLLCNANSIITVV